MHGYFVSLKLYDAARLIANPFAYAEHREKMVREKMEKQAETRIRSKKEVGVKVNKALAEKILREEEKEKKREEKRRLKKAEKEADATMEVDEEPVEEGGEAEKPSILNDPRFSMVFENPEFAVDEDSREYALMNPSAAAQKRNGARGKTAVEDEEEESDKMSSDGLGESDSESDTSEDGGSDSSDAGGQSLFYFVLFLLLSLYHCILYYRAQQVRSPRSPRAEKHPSSGGIHAYPGTQPHCWCQPCPNACTNRRQ